MLISPGSLKSFNEVPDKVPVIPAGLYCIQINQFTKEELGNDKSPALILQYTVVGGINGIESPQAGRRGRHTLWLLVPNDTEQQAVRKNVAIKQVFSSCGIFPEDDGNYDANKLTGARCNVEMVVNVKGSDEFSNISRFLKTDGSRF